PSYLLQGSKVDYSLRRQARNSVVLKEDKNLAPSANFRIMLDNGTGTNFLCSLRTTGIGTTKHQILICAQKLAMFPAASLPPKGQNTLIFAL
uniref:Uncharacterized protein n=1 Tax=Megaselia scalaris TaxID=36166 RepID=T1GWF2_MEGSC